MEPILPAENVSYGSQCKPGITTRFPKKCCRRTSSGVLTPLMAHTTVEFGKVAFVECVQEQSIDDEGLVTLICEVESILNSRPITFVSDNPADLEPLTPNHLLLLKCDSPMPPGVFQKENVFSRGRWRQIQYLSDIFWKRWSREYLPLLQSRQKWLFPRRNLAVGDVVLVAAENTPQNCWPLGRIQEVFPDKKGLVRKVKVKVKSAVLERPIDKLVLLVEEGAKNILP